MSVVEPATRTVEVFNPAGEQIEQFRGGGDHFKNFLDAVRIGPARGSQRRSAGRAFVERAVPHGECLAPAGREADGVGDQAGGRRQAGVCRVGRPAARSFAGERDRRRFGDRDAWPVARIRPGERAVHQQRRRRIILCGAKIASRSSCRRLRSCRHYVFLNVLSLRGIDATVADSGGLLVLLAMVVLAELAICGGGSDGRAVGEGRGREGRRQAVCRVSHAVGPSAGGVAGHRSDRQGDDPLLSGRAAARRRDERSSASPFALVHARQRQRPRFLDQPRAVASEHRDQAPRIRRDREAARPARS